MYNSVTFIGRLGKDLNVRQVGESYTAETTLATWKSRKNDKGEWEEQTEWHNIVMWAKNPEYFNTYHKGDMVMFTGEVRNRSYQDKEGNTKYITENVGNMKKIPRAKGEVNGNTIPPETQNYMPF